VAQAAVDLAKVNLDYTKVYAPISGQIGRSFVTDGTLVTANQSQALAMITQLDPIYVDMQQSLAETDVTNIQEQMAAGGEIPVHLMIGKENEKAYAHQGTLKFSEVTVNELTSSVTLRALFNNPDGTLLPGAFVRALLDLGDTEVILVPQRATTRTPEGKLKVWTIDAEGKAQPRIVTASQAHEDQWIVQEGLNPGDKLIVEGYQKVQPGAPVTAVSTPTEKQVNTPPKGQ
jgi:membrane fusion protein (multidrug efflux system)